MKEKCCKNCLYFQQISDTRYRYTEVKYACYLHGPKARVTDPEDQFCGDKHWISVKVKTRIDNLEKLGI